MKIPPVPPKKAKPNATPEAKPTPAPETEPNETVLDNFIRQASDSKTYPRIRRGKKIQISIAIDEALLERIEEMAGRRGTTRSGLIAMALHQLLENGLHLTA